MGAFAHTDFNTESLLTSITFVVVLADTPFTQPEGQRGKSKRLSEHLTPEGLVIPGGLHCLLESVRWAGAGDTWHSTGSKPREEAVGGNFPSVIDMQIIAAAAPGFNIFPDCLAWSPIIQVYVAVSPKRPFWSHHFHLSFKDRLEMSVWPPALPPSQDSHMVWGL